MRFFVRYRRLSLWNRISVWGSIVSILSLFGLLIQITFFPTQETIRKSLLKNIPPEKLMEIESKLTEVDKIQKRLDEITALIEQLDADFDDLKEIPQEQKIALQLSNIVGNLKDFEQRFSKLEAIILEDPEKVLTSVLLRRDIELLKEEAVRNRQDLEAEINKANSISQWFIGIIITIAVGFLGLAVPGLLKLRYSRLEEQNVNQLDD